MYTEIINKLIKRADAQKKIRVEIKELREVLEGIFKYIQYFNSLDEYQVMVFNRPMSEINIIKELSHFINPASVRIDSSDKGWKDLLLRDDKLAGESELSLHEFYDYQMRFRGFFKRNFNDDVVSLSELRRHVNLVDILPKVSTNNKVWYTGNAYIPVKVSDDVFKLDRNIHFTVDAIDVVSDFISTLSFC